MLPRKLRIQYGYGIRIKIEMMILKKRKETFKTYRIGAYEGLAPSRKISTEGRRKQTHAKESKRILVLHTRKNMDDQYGSTFNIRIRPTS